MTRKLQLVSDADLDRVIGGVRFANVSDWMISGVVGASRTRALAGGGSGGFIGLLGMPGFGGLGGEDDVNVGQPLPPPPAYDPQDQGMDPQGGGCIMDPIGDLDSTGMDPMGMDPMGMDPGLDELGMDPTGGGCQTDAGMQDPAMDPSMMDPEMGVQAPGLGRYY